MSMRSRHLMAICLCIAPGVLPAQRDAKAAGARETRKTLSVIQDFRAGGSAVQARNPLVKLSMGHDAARGDEPVLIVAYPAATNDPSARDVWCSAAMKNWKAGRAIAFQV